MTETCGKALIIKIDTTDLGGEPKPMLPLQGQTGDVRPAWVAHGQIGRPESGVGCLLAVLGTSVICDPAQAQSFEP